MEIEGKTALVTGANGGIGRALIEALLDKGAARIYAGARTTSAVAELAHIDENRVFPVRLDVTHPASVAAAAERCRDVDLLINNAGVNRGTWLTGPAGQESAREEMEVNFFGTLTMCRAFAPVLASRGGGAIVNICSILGLVNLPLNGTYCASKAAVHSMLQGLRAELAPRNIVVVGVYPGPVDTRMTADLETPKATPGQVAAAILAGLEKGDEDIFPDPLSREVNGNLAKNPKHVERAFAAMIPA